MPPTGRTGFPTCVLRRRPFESSEAILGKTAILGCFSRGSALTCRIPKIRVKRQIHAWGYPAGLLAGLRHSTALGLGTEPRFD